MVFRCPLIPNICLKTRFFVCLALLLVCFSLFSQAATNWVSPTGNNTTGNGSATNPYATIQKAIDVSATGDLIILKAGTYAGTGNANLSVTSESLTIWSESGPSNTIVDAGRQKVLTANLSGDPGFTQQLSFHGLTFTNGYIQSNTNWSHDSLIRINSGTVEFYDCVFRQNEVRATSMTTSVWLVGTATTDANQARFLARNCLFVSNNIGSGGSDGGGAIFWGPTNCLIDRVTIYGNAFYNTASGDGARRIGDNLRVTNVLSLSNSTLTRDAFMVPTPVGYSYVQNAGTGTAYTNSLINVPLFVNAAAGNFDPAANSPVINAGDPAAPLDPDGSRADIGYSSARVLSGSNWVNALPAFTNNAFTGGTLDQWEVDGGGTRTVQNDGNATDGKSAYIYELHAGVKLRSPAFVCGEGWRARARYRNPGGLSSCGFIVYDAANNNYLLGANLEDDAYATKEYDLSRFAGQTIKVGVAGGNVVVDFVEVLAPAAYAGQPLGSRRPNSFLLQSSQAGSTTDIDNLRVVNLDTGTAIYSNSFSSTADATNNLDNYYWPQGGQSTTNFVLNGPMTRVVGGKLRLETTGFNANGSGGYESHSEAEWGSTLPRNFLVEFEATRLQWAGHFHFHLFRKEPSDSRGSHMIGGAMSSTRSLTNRQDVPRMAASGSWFQQYGLITNWNGTQGWAVSFSAPGGNLQSTHRLGMSVSNSTLSFYLNGNLLASTNIQDFQETSLGSAPVISSWPTAAPITYGQALSNSVLSGGVPIPPATSPGRCPPTVRMPAPTPPMSPSRPARPTTTFPSAPISPSW